MAAPLAASPLQMTFDPSRDYPESGLPAVTFGQGDGKGSTTFVLQDNGL